MGRKKLLFFALFLSLLIHLILVVTVDGYKRLFIKRQDVQSEQNRYFEVVPYPSSGWKDFPESKKNTRFLGPKNYFTKEETIPKIGKFPSPKIFEQMPVIQEQLEETNKKETEIKAEEKPKNLLQNEKEIRRDDTDVVVKERLPAYEKLVPKTPELLAKMPKEESINLNRGTVKSGKELIINTKEYKYWYYLQRMKNKIELLWQYPEEAKVRGLSGLLKINFSVDKSGKLKEIVITDSSGYKFFDDAAVKALKDAAPFSVFPDTWDIERLNIEGTFIYELNVLR